MTASFVIFDIICRLGEMSVAVAVPLFGLADLVEVVLADEIADGPVAQAQEGSRFLQAAAHGGQGLRDAGKKRGAAKPPPLKKCVRIRPEISSLR
jgi:hypothetical protein